MEIPLGRPPPIGRLSILEHLVNSYKVWQEIVSRFKKDLRYTLEAKITTSYLEVLEMIFLASITSGAQKLPILQTASMKLDLLKFFMQIAWESKAMDNKKYALFSEQLAQIGRMLGGWRKDAAAKLIKANPTP